MNEVSEQPDPVLLEHLAPLLSAAARLPVVVYEAVEDISIRDLVCLARDYTKVESPRRRRPSVSIGQTEETAELDQIVYNLVHQVAVTEKKGVVRMVDLVQYLPDVNDQRIRRALVRLRNAGKIIAEGNTRLKTYRIAA